MAEKIAEYSFVPWARKGVANQINQQDTLGNSTGSANRASIDVDVKIDKTKIAGGLETTTVTKEVHIFGPGDIVGIHRDAIVRTEPRNGITNFEPNYLPYIEFYEEDFAWRYTPAKNKSDKLRPWLALFIMEEGVEFEFNKFNPLIAPLPSITVQGGPKQADLFPPHNQFHTWAHVHVNTPLDEEAGSNVGEKLAALVQRNPNQACSRLLSPRNLEPNKRYHAFVVPAYEKGRLAGMGASQDEIDAAKSQQFSWGFDHTSNSGQWPIYHQWSFRTGSEGDFEALVRKLQPRAIDKRVGRRFMDLQNAGYALDFEGDVEGAKGAIYLEGALRVPGNTSKNHVSSKKAKMKAFTSDLQDLLNLEKELRQKTTVTGKFAKNPFFTNALGQPVHNIIDDPIITPPIYGKWHLIKEEVDKNRPLQWLNQLNLDAKNRATAGFGANVIRKNQESYMDRAWEQFGAILEANRKLLMAQLAEQLSHNLHAKHFEKLDANRYLNLTKGVMNRVMIGDKTITSEIQASKLSNAVISRAFTKIARVNGPLEGKVAPRINIAEQVIKTNSIGTKASSVAYDQLDFPADMTIGILHQEVQEQVKNTSGIRRSSFNRGAAFSMLNFAFKDAETASLSKSFKDYDNYFKPGNWNIKPEAANLKVGTVSSVAKKALGKGISVRQRIWKRLRIPQFAPTVPEKIVPIMVAPEYTDPMYKELVKISSELFLPNLNLIPNNTISILESNQLFIESYLVGLNHEFSRELLWREFLTDQRGSYFRQFWEVKGSRKTDKTLSDALFTESLKDIDYIHKWKSTGRLGKNRPKVSGANVQDKMVVVIKGELLKKYPNTIIYLQKAAYKRKNGIPKLNAPRDLDKNDSAFLFPIFEAKVNPDIYFIGFDISVDTAKGDINNINEPGYFVVMKERSGEIRFGMDIGPTTGNSSWEDLNWNNFPSDFPFIKLNQAPPNPSREGLTWNSQINAAEMASILYQNPFLMAIHADDMLHHF